MSARLELRRFGRCGTHTDSGRAQSRLFSNCSRKVKLTSAELATPRLKVLRLPWLSASIRLRLPQVAQFAARARNISAVEALCR
jgi:hypothetical protein